MFKTTTSRIIFSVIAIIAVAGLYFFVKGFGDKKSSQLKATVKKGKFEITVITTGELQALNSEDIKGPSGLRQAGIWQVKIADLIPEGTVVKEGDHIATLDRSEISNKLKDLSSELSKIESQYLQTKLDTALEMRRLRDELQNLKFAREEKELILKQSQYEPPATIRQAELDLEKTKRTYEQEKKNYQLKLQQNRAKMQTVAATLEQQKNKYDQMTDLLKEFVVTAPKAGMLIYKKDWNGRKIAVGSNVGAWDPVVATLPDLTTMVSKTYVNEVDISKIRKDQVVQIGVDAFPEKKFSGKVISVANVGEQLPNNDAKVFEVSIQINEKDTLLRPAMTTSNIIITQTIPNAIHIPLEALHGNDSLTFVYKDNGASIVKQEILVGATGSDEAYIKEGLKEGETVYLSEPEDAEKMKIVYLEKKEKRVIK